MTPYRIDVHHCVIPGLVEQLARAGVHQIGGAALPAWTFEDSIAMMACFDPVFEDFPGRHQQRAALGPRVRPDQSGAHRGARPPARGGPDRRGAADRGPELRQLEPRAQGVPVKSKDCPLDPPPAVRDRTHGWPPSASSRWPCSPAMASRAWSCATPTSTDRQRRWPRSWSCLSCQVQVILDQGVDDESVCGRSDGSDWQAAGAASGCRWS
jgi:hypothetical protein